MESGSDLEDLPTAPSAQVPQTSLGLATLRICIGISMGASIVALFFTAWAIWNDLGGPAIGTAVFQVIALGALVVVAYRAIIVRSET